MIVILGTQGQVSAALIAQLGARAAALGSQQLDLRLPDVGGRLSAVTEAMPVEAVINAAAYTAVDKAETERELAMRVNGHAVGELAQWCAQKKIPLLHYSTDYVFDGSGTQARTEDAPTAPLSVYGESKLLGEQLIAASGAEHMIFRTSWVYDATGKNFLNSMRRLFKEREEVRVVADQIGAPTYAPHLAAATLQALERFQTGIYHLCGGGETSWHRFAQEIFALACKHESGITCKLIQPITTREYPTPATRPLNSRLDCSKAKTELGIALPHWEDALKECYETIKLRD